MIFKLMGIWIGLWILIWINCFPFQRQIENIYSLHVQKQKSMIVYLQAKTKFINQKINR